MSWSNGKSTSLLRKPYKVVPWNTTQSNPSPMFRCQAWALQAAHNEGARFSVASCNRRDDTLAWFNKEYGTSHAGQQYLYDHQHDPGFYPANPPTRTSHCGYEDGSQYYPSPGKLLPSMRWGIDAEDDGSANDASKLVATLNHIGITAAKAYPGSSSENHHIVILASTRQVWLVLFRQRAKKHPKTLKKFTTSRLKREPKA